MSSAPRISLIAALDENYAIGRDGQLPWHLPDDLKRFKQLTLGKPVLMGRKTAQSIGRPLPGRRNIVLSLSRQPPFAGDNVTMAGSVEEALSTAGDAELMVIGGGEIYRHMLSSASRMYLTHVYTLISGADTSFPAFLPGDWISDSVEHHPADARHPLAFDFVDYTRK
jgi:dihydrofolate reductase